jgi:crotonobetainyl-CoA:carnitine CoA-transferase CaiB-like acyl-CoA transferase
LPLLEERLRKRTRDEWFHELLAAGVPCAPINTIDEGVAFATGLGLEPVVEVGGVPGIRNPITFSGTPAGYRLPPPGLDEHGEEIRAWLSS